MSKNKHRVFYVDGRLEFSLFFDATKKNQDKIITDFLNSKDFKCMAAYCNWKVKSTKISEDLNRVDVELCKN